MRYSQIEMGIRTRALRCSRDVERLVAVWKEGVLKMSYERAIVCVLILGKWWVCHMALNVEIETIHNGVSKRSRLVSVGPCCSHGAESAPKEFGKISGYRWAGEVVIRGRCST